MIFEYQAEREHLKALGTNFTPATNWYVGLSSTVPVRDGTNITEPSTGSYARVSTNANTTDWIEGTTASYRQNAASIAFTTATADWLSGTQLLWGVIFDAVSGGNALYAQELSQAQAVLSGNQYVIAAGGFVIYRL